MSTQKNSMVTWPSHGPRGRHDWWTYLERGYADPFRDVLRKMPDVVDAPFDDSGRTMLMYAVSSSIEIVNILIRAGADVNRRDSCGRPVWDFAPTSGPSCVEIWRTLIQAGLNLSSRGTKNETPLIRVCGVYIDPAAWPGNVEVVKTLLKAGADPNMVGNGTRSALFDAAVHGHARVVQVLLQAGAHVEAATLGNRGSSEVEGVTPLIAAAEGGHLDVVHLLVDAGADVNRSDASGFTALMGAARLGHSKIVKFLLERGACPDVVDASGRNALTYAIEFKHQQEIAPILRQVRNKDGSV